jgi:hypothetical protein
VKDRINCDAVLGRFVEDLKWESPDERPAELVHGNRVEVGMALETKDARLDAAQEILPESRFTALVPPVGVCNILFSFARINNALNHAALVLAA